MPIEKKLQLTKIVHHRLTEQLNRGDWAVDATAGNGYDTLKMAELVGAEGRVLAVDVQEAAIEATRGRLVAAGWAGRATLVWGDHAHVLEASRGEFGGRAAAVVFNLGYLPGSDKQIQTGPKTTLAALDAALELLKSGGCLLVTAYRGHPGGMEEAEAVEAWMRRQATLGKCLETCAPLAKEAALTAIPALPPVLWLLRVGEF